MDKVIEFLEYEEYQVFVAESCMEVETITPAGEDWIFTIPFCDTMEQLTEALWELYSDFDVDEEASMWIAHRGENGVPSSVSLLLKDAEWKEEELQRLYVKARTISNVKANDLPEDVSNTDNIMYVTQDTFSMLLHEWERDKEAVMRQCFYTMNGSEYVGVDNSSGEFYTESFLDKEDCLKWLSDESISAWDLKSYISDQSSNKETSDDEMKGENNMEEKEMVKRALERGVARLINNPNDGCISCQIGEKYYWFYFMDDPEYENMTPEEIYERFSLDELADMIDNAINGLDPDEIMYYDSIMSDLL